MTAVGSPRYVAPSREHGNLAGKWLNYAVAVGVAEQGSIGCMGMSSRYCRRDDGTLIAVTHFRRKRNLLSRGPRSRAGFDRGTAMIRCSDK